MKRKTTMTTEDLLLTLGGPRISMRVALGPVTRRRGVSVLDTFTPDTAAERLLVEAARPIFEPGYTDTQFDEYVAALTEVYREQGYDDIEWTS